VANDTVNRQQFAQQLLTQMHLPVTDSNVNFLVGWEQAENTTAANNPLATTWPGVPGATAFNNLNGGGHVWNYPTPAAGVTATADTLNGGNYPSIVSALQGGDAMNANLEGSLGNNLSTWSGGGYTTVPVPNSGTVAVGTSTTGGGYYAQSPGGSGMTTAGGGGSEQAAGTTILGNCSSSKQVVGGLGVSLLNQCQAKALVSGLLVFAGGVSMLIGIALLFASGKGVAGKIAEGAGAGIALVPGAEIAGAAIARAGHKQSQQSKAFHADRAAARAQRKAGISSAQGRQTPAQSQAQTARNRQIAKRPATTGRERAAMSNPGNDDFS
jgi:hypothetical protein